MTINTSVAPWGLEDNLRVIEVPAWVAKSGQKIKNIAQGAKNLIDYFTIGQVQYFAKELPSSVATTAKLIVSAFKEPEKNLVEKIELAANYSALVLAPVAAKGLIYASVDGIVLSAIAPFVKDSIQELKTSHNSTSLTDSAQMPVCKAIQTDSSLDTSLIAYDPSNPDSSLNNQFHVVQVNPYATGQNGLSLYPGDDALAQVETAAKTIFPETTDIAVVDSKQNLISPLSRFRPMPWGDANIYEQHRQIWRSSGVFFSISPDCSEQEIMRRINVLYNPEQGLTTGWGDLNEVHQVATAQSVTEYQALSQSQSPENSSPIFPIATGLFLAAGTGFLIYKSRK